VSDLGQKLLFNTDNRKCSGGAGEKCDVTHSLEGRVKGALRRKILENILRRKGGGKGVRLKKKDFK